MSESFEEELLDEDDEPIEQKDQAPAALISPNKIDLPIVVEVDRIQMSLSKLLEIRPGNILELSVHPASGVFLTLQGKKIAKGELLQLGEVLGVRIVEIGET